MIVVTSHSSPTTDQETESWFPYCVVCSSLLSSTLKSWSQTSQKWN